MMTAAPPPLYNLAGKQGCHVPALQRVYRELRAYGQVNAGSATLPPFQLRKRAALMLNLFCHTSMSC